MMSSICKFPVRVMGKRSIYLAAILATLNTAASFATSCENRLPVSYPLLTKLLLDSNAGGSSKVQFRLGPVTQSQSDERAEVPDEREQREKRKEIKLLFKDQYSDRSDDGRKKLANQLLKISQESSENPIYQYVCLTESIEVATACSAAETALDAVYILTANFDVNAKKIKLETVHNLARKLNDASEASILISKARPAIEEFINNHEYKSAAEMTKKMAVIARKFGDTFSALNFNQEAERLKKIDRQYRSIQSSRLKLETDNNAPEANQAVGEFYCFVVGDFATGTEYLAKGSKPELKKIAQLEISNSGTSKESIKIADSWWDVASELDELGAQNVRRHAEVYYLKEVEQLTGIAKATVKSRLKQLAQDPKFPMEGQWVARWSNGGGTLWDPIVFLKNGTWTASSSSGLFEKGQWTVRSSTEIVMSDSRGQSYTISQVHHEAGLRQLEIRQFREGKLLNKAILKMKK